MNATELFLSLLSDRGSALFGAQASTRPVAMASGQEAFSQTLARALEPRQQASFNTGGAQQQQSSQPAQQTVSKTEAPRAERKQTETARPEAERQQQVAEKPRTAPRESGESKAQETAPENAPAAAAKTQSSARTAEAQLREVVDKLEEAAQQAQDGGDMDELMQELILDLLALLLAGRNDGQELQALAEKLGITDLAQTDGLTLMFFMDKDSELYKLVSMLLNDESGLDPEMLDQIKLLVKLAGDKAVQVNVSELTGNADAEDGAATLSLTFGAQQGEDAEKVSITIRLTPESAQSAQIVSMTQGQAPATEAALLVPAGLLNEEELKTLTQQQAKAGDAQGTRIMVQSDGQTQKPQVLIPMAGSMDAAKPEVLTADAMLKSADNMLKQLDMQALAQELAAMSKPREELAARFEQLLGSKSTAESLALLTVAGKSGGFDFLNSFMQRFGQDADSDGQKWQADLFQQQVKAQMNSDRASTSAPMMSNGSERIAFLGRSESAQNLFQQTVQETATSSRAPQSSAQVQQSVMYQIAERISYAQYNAQGGEIRIGLRPEHLGDLHLKIRVDQDVVVAKFVAQSHEVKAIIESNLGQLRDALEEAGVKVGRFEVSVDTGSGRQQDAGEPGRNGQAETAVSATDIAEQGLEPMLVDDAIYSMRPMAISAYRHNYLA